MEYTHLWPESRNLRNILDNSISFPEALVNALIS